MKKFIITIIMGIITLCAYANTCTYGDIRVTLREESVTVTNNSPYGNKGYVNVSVNDVKATEVRVLVECNGQRRDITVKLTNGYGSFNVCDHFSGLKERTTYTVKLINVPGMCF